MKNGTTRSDHAREKNSDLKSDSPRRANCWKCAYFAVSWDPDYPYSCAAMGFKSKRLPSLEVINSSGVVCQAFKQKDYT